MALTWQWKDKIGEIVNPYTMDSKTKVCLYRGNAMCIAINEYPDDTYSLAWFANDRQHFRNMLGLTKGYKNIFTHGELYNVKFYVNDNITRSLAHDIIRAGLAGQIVFTEKEDNAHE